MKLEINNHTYEFLMLNEFGPQYRYECLFGSSFAQDMLSENVMTKKLAIMRFIYAIIINDNDVVEESFEEFLRYTSDEQMTEMVEFYQNRFATIHKLNANARGNEEEQEGNNPKKN